MTDDNLDLTVSITWSRNGGAYKKLRDIAHNKVISKKIMNFFCPVCNLSRTLSELTEICRHADVSRFNGTTENV